MTYAFVGLMVLYRLTEDEALMTNKRREDARQNRDKMREDRPGFQAHGGNHVSEGDRVAMVVTNVGVWDGKPAVNGQAFLDGYDSLWVVGTEEGDAPGQWEAITNG